jgi:hypothetical protein
MMQAAFGGPRTIVGMIEASADRNPVTLWTFSSVLTAAMGSWPMAAEAIGNHTAGTARPDDNIIGVVPDLADGGL